MTAKRPAAVLWDMDGTIVDTEPVWVDAQRMLLADFALPQLDAEAEEALVGASMFDAATLFQRLGVPLPHAEIIAIVIAHVLERMRLGVEWRPGAIELLAELRERGVPQGLVTNSPCEMAAITAAGLPADTFDVIVGADDVTRSKPHPQPYLLAAARLAVDPERCVAIEDSPHGLHSARAAGMVTIGIPHGATLTPSDTDVLVETLDGFSANDLDRAYGEARS